MRKPPLKTHTGGGKSYDSITYSERTVTGIVVDSETGDPLTGAYVLEKGTNNAAITDLDGKFSLKIKSPNLVISFIGYESEEVSVETSQIVVKLSYDKKMIEESVVTALGIKRSEKALSYNVQKVKGDVLNNIKDANFINSLNGKVAGVNIQRSASGVGGATRVVMRGSKSISGDNNVLYVVDGIPLFNITGKDKSADGSGFGSGRVSSEGIADINPEDIEDISVLTGPSAAALYGANAANGVILITTKKGSAGSLKINFASSVEFSNPFILPELQTTYGSVEGNYTSWGNKLDKPSDYTVKQFFNTAVNYNNSVNFSVGNKNNQTYFSLSSIDSKGIIPNNKYNRYNVTIRNTSVFLNDKLTLDLSASYVRDFQNNMISYGMYFNPIVGLYLYPPQNDFSKEKYFERYDMEEGVGKQYWSPGDLGIEAQNPYWIAYRNIRPQVKDRFILFGSLRYDITKNLNVTARVKLDKSYSQSEDKRYASTISTYAKPNGRYSFSNRYYIQQYADVILNYNREIGKNFRFQINAGSSIEDYDSKGNGYGGDLALIPNKFIYANIDPKTAVPNQDGGDSRYQNVALFTSAELSYKSKLFLTVTARGDKSSKLVNSKTPWLWYPSVGLSAVVTDFFSESTKAAMRPVLSYFKVRASYTDVGSPIPYTGLTPNTQTRNMQGGTVKQFEYYPVTDLKGENTKSYEFGFDSRWWNDNITLNMTVYNSNTYNQLLKASLGKGSGYSHMLVQAGNVRNRGLEITVGLNQRIADFKYSTHFTATANRNKIIKLASAVKNPITGAEIDLSKIVMGRFILVEGGEIGDVYDTKRIKRDADGYVSYDNGKNLETENVPAYKIGSVNAKWNFGWKNEFSYKGLNLSMLFTARLGGIVISKTQAYLDKYGVSKESALKRDEGGVKLGENLTVDPEAYYSAIFDIDSYHTYSATNARLQELSLSYMLPDKLFKNIVKNVTFSVYATNLWMIYNKAPYDPELTATTGIYGQGYDNFMLPSLRTVGMGFKCRF